MDDKSLIQSHETRDIFLEFVREAGSERIFKNTLRNHGCILTPVFVTNMEDLMQYASDKEEFNIALDIQESLKKYG